MPQIKIGVFDSGAGGIHVAEAIQKALPEHQVLYMEDREHVPYGTRPIEEIHRFVKPILQALVDEGCQVIVVACNTVTTNLISRLRKEFDIPLVGMEPAVKPAAAATKTGIIAVCATPRTLSSARYSQLKKEYATGIRVLEPDCSDWALMIENNSIEREKVAENIENMIKKGADQIVLGCTHYHWIEELIKEIADGRAVVIQPEEPVIRQLKTVLAQLT